MGIIKNLDVIIIICLAILFFLMGELGMVVILSFVAFFFLTGRYLFKNLTKFYLIERKRLFKYFSKTNNNIGEYLVTIVVAVIIAGFTFLVYKVLMIFIVYPLSGDLVDFFIKHRSVFSVNKNPLQNPFSIQNILSGAILAPIAQFASIYLMIKGFKVFMLSINQKFRASIYTYSSLVYFSTIALLCFLLIELFAYSQSITLFNTIANGCVLLGAKFAYLLYLYAILHCELMPKEQYQNNLRRDWKFNSIESILLTNKKLLLIALSLIGMLLNLPLYIGFQFSGNWIVLLKLIPALALFYLILKKSIAKGFDYIGVHMVDDTRQEELSSIPFDKWYKKTIIIGFSVLGLILIFNNFNSFFFFLFFTIILSICIYGLLIFSYFFGSLIKLRWLNFRYLKIIFTSFSKLHFITILIALSAFTLLTIYPKAITVKDYVAYQKNIIDTNGNLLYFANSDENPSSPVTFEQLPAFFKKALIIKEDRGFYKQNNLFFNKQNWHGVSVTGRSNLVQQLTKNWSFSSEFPQEVQRKVSEIICSYQLSISNTPEDILTHYVNTVSFNGGKGHKGIMNASYYTFGKSINNINELEMLYLIHTLHRGKDFKIDNENYVLYDDAKLHAAKIKDRLLFFANQWLENDYITKKEYRRLKRQNLKFTNKKFRTNNTGAMNSFYAKSINEIKNVTMKSTINDDFQNLMKSAQDRFNRKVNAYSIKKRSKFYSAAIVVKVGTGEIIGYDPGRGSSDLIQFGNGHQMASPIKPFVLMELLEQGHEIKLYDGVLRGRKTPKNNKKSFSNQYVDENPIIKDSKNAPFRNIDELTEPIPIFLAMEEKFSKMNISPDPDINLSDKAKKMEHIVNYPIGSRRMSLYDIAQAYQVLINDGDFIPLNHITETSNPYSIKTSKVTQTSINIYNPTNTYLLKNALKKPLETGGTANYLNNYLPEGEFMVKTGTSHLSRHHYCIVSDGDYLVVSWVSYGKLKNNDLRLGTEEISLSSSRTAGVLASFIFDEIYNKALM